MRVLTHSAHSGFEYELAKTGHDFYCIGPWEDYRRPQPANWHLISQASDDFDVGIVVPAPGWDKVFSTRVPLVYHMLGDNGEGVFAPDLDVRCSAFVFLGAEVAARWRMIDESKKRVIELGVDPEEFKGYVGDGKDALTVGWSVPSRWEKGFPQLRAIDEQVPVTLVGEGNEVMRSAIGTVGFEDLKQAYRSHKVYVNPGCIIGISVVEAMMTGMPVVTFRPINLKDIIIDGINGFVVDTVHGAIERIRELLADSALRRRIGDAARETASRRFGLARFVESWNALLEKCARRSSAVARPSE